ncbi:hypothetical protein [Streptomyces sp. NPDC096153]|uniref:hypothetical protein n=1 Tax=Streptomyces sp. NPDC096153 TaxID=3155548 RepID=UPI0033236F5C
MAANPRTARKRTPAKRAAPSQPPEGFEPVRLSSKQSEPKAEDRVVLFYVDDEPYTVPKRIGRNHGLRYLRTARRQGEPIAAQELLETLIGEDGYEALMNCDDLEDDQLDQIMNRLRDEALGAVEEEKQGNAGRR